MRPTPLDIYRKGPEEVLKRIDIIPPGKRIEEKFPPKKTDEGWSYYLANFGRYTPPYDIKPSDWYSVPEEYLKEVFSKHKANANNNANNIPEHAPQRMFPLDQLMKVGPPKKVFYNFPSPHQEPSSQSYAQAVNQMGPGMGAALNQVPRLNVVNPVYQLGGDSINPALASQLRMLMEQSQGIPYSGHHSGRRINPTKKILQYFNPVLYSPDEYAEADYV